VCRERVHVSARPGEGLRRTRAEPRAYHTMNSARLDRWSPMGSSCCGEWSKSHEHRREGEKGMRASVALMIAALVIGSIVSSCAAGWPTTPTATPCAFIERCRNPGLSTGGN
jgi:hypothetical protein